MKKIKFGLSQFLIVSLSAVIFFGGVVQADTFNGGRKNNAKPSAFYDTSVSTYGYTSHYDAGRAYWNENSNVNITRTFSVLNRPDIYYIDNTAVSGLYGRIYPYNSSGVLVSPDSYWDYTTVFMYDNQMRATGSNFTSSRVKYNAAHEVGHTIKMAHVPIPYNSVMVQGWWNIPASITSYDSGEVNSKWLSLPFSSSSSDENPELEGMETITVHGNFEDYIEEDQLFEAAELIVIAETNKNFADREHVVRYAESDLDLPRAIADFYTKTPIMVSKVLKQPNTPVIYENDTLSIIEPITLIEDNHGLKRLTTEGYLETKEGDKYILYLKKNTYGEYSVINMSNGKFNLESDMLSKLGHDNEQDKHEEMKKAVEKRFENQINEVLKTS